MVPSCTGGGATAMAGGYAEKDSSAKGGQCAGSEQMGPHQQVSRETFWKRFVAGEPKADAHHMLTTVGSI